MSPTILCLVAVVPALGCAGGASCKESCEEDADCGDGMSCLNTTAHGFICLPGDCQTWYADGKTCQYDENLGEQADGELAECYFRECGW